MPTDARTAARETLRSMNPLSWSDAVKQGIVFAVLLTALTVAGIAVTVAVASLGGWWIAASVFTGCLTIFVFVFVLVFVAKWED